MSSHLRAVGSRRARSGAPARRSVRFTRPVASLPASFDSVSPLGGRLLVKVAQKEPVSAGGILLPTSAQKKQTTGKVVAMDDADVATVKVGDDVLYSQYAGTEVEFKEEDHVILKAEDVIGTMPSADPAKLQPCGMRVLIECNDAEESSAGGVLLTEAAKERPLTGRVVAIGEGMPAPKGDKDAVAKKVCVKVGANVLYSKYAGTDLEGDDGKSYIVVADSDILAELA